jgi:hypothetical protein
MTAVAAPVNLDNKKASDVYERLKTMFERSLDLLAMKKDFVKFLLYELN